MHEVVLVNLKTGKRFTKEFESLFLCKKFVEKCRRSKSLRLISFPIFD